MLETEYRKYAEHLKQEAKEYLSQYNDLPENVTWDEDWLVETIGGYPDYMDMAILGTAVDEFYGISETVLDDEK